MLFRAIIVDDEQKGIDALSLLISDFAPKVKLVATTDKPEAAIELIENYRPEIIFLDINMPGMNGFELLQRLTWKSFSLVFTTAHQEYALRALRNNAVDYLLKPVDPDDLIEAIERIESRMNKGGDHHFEYDRMISIIRQADTNRLLVSSRTGIEALRPEEIVYLESHSNYTDIHLSDSRVIVSSKTLKDFDHMLCNPGSMFMRVHHSFIVNLQRVERYFKESDSLIVCDRKVPVAKSRRAEFLKWLNVT